MADKMKRITFTESLSSMRESYRGGGTYNVPETEANEYLTKGLATEVVEMVPKSSVQQSPSTIGNSSTTQTPPETLYAGHPLAFFVNKSDEEIDKVKGVGPEVFKQIKQALKDAGKK